MKKKDLTKETKILDATVAIIINYGASAISTTKVAKHVGISQSNIYLYFEDKQALLEGVYLREISRLEETPEMKLVMDADRPIIERCFNYLKAMYDFAMANPYSLFVISQIKGLSKSFPDLIEKLVSGHNPVATLFEDGVQAGVLRSIDRSLPMTLIFSVIQRHVENVQNGSYAKNVVSFEELSRLIWGGIAIVPYPSHLLHS
ncbi:TetR/AcrR family transcriptional regulator [Lentilactobacillus parafarraginis]|jgi:AcrR family transcriptional regulator|uniref:Transcriptional regulator n=2 Tax=Lentilactobacillus parafarraginis TaxID=390842 RepID=A0A0R1YGH0_9LACO|nr:TetR/AcrR family transcriptional regulator [Lentilactobacillus parafarraginis]KRM41394.1 transcriptional regulator [Lentilactobacillus parafarraginis DSM 18390 = JCM 14109]TLQ18441.1 TetR/AcrR family transcriptional regulator [Lentilactobacillus parafarraginis]